MLTYYCANCDKATEHEVHFDRLDSGKVMYNDTCMGIQTDSLPHTEEKQTDITSWEKIILNTVGSM